MNAKDVLIAGAGPTGLSLACGLLLHGVSVRVVDKAQGSATTSRANILHARGVEVLDRLGAFGEPGRRRARPRVRARAQPIGQLRKGGKTWTCSCGHEGTDHRLQRRHRRGGRQGPGRGGQRRRTLKGRGSFCRIRSIFGADVWIADNRWSSRALGFTS
jgi:2-polyprenyl-6-methoxyphenol hydroxylase-like FAD-dependent oxidoreductase